MRQTDEDVAHLRTGIDLCYDTFGNPEDPALLLVMGLAGPLTWWSTDLCRLLAEHGFFVVRFDNRDVGRSTKLTDLTARHVDVLRAALLGQVQRPPYTLGDMAADAVGLLDHLAVPAAHVTGVSMGGMIAQTMAIEHPDRVLSLVSVMSTTGRRSVGWLDPRLLPRFVARSRGISREDYIRTSARTWQLIGSPAYPTPPEEVRRRAGETFDRGVDQSGVIRQLQAILAQPDRTRALRDVRVPTTVVHGLRDRMVHVSGGRATAQAVPDAKLVLVPGMGHDLPVGLWPQIAATIQRTADSAAR